MPYKISGNINSTARILIIEDSNYSISHNSIKTVGNYEVLNLASGTKYVLAIKDDGAFLGYSRINPIYYT